MFVSLITKVYLLKIIYATVTYCSIRNVNFYIHVYHFYTIFVDFIIIIQMEFLKNILIFIKYINTDKKFNIVFLNIKMKVQKICPLLSIIYHKLYSTNISIYHSYQVLIKYLQLIVRILIRIK